jgi:hypothetical protein
MRILAISTDGSLPPPDSIQASPHKSQRKFIPLNATPPLALKWVTNGERKDALVSWMVPALNIVSGGQKRGSKYR